jgi:hypothetical protein
MGTWGTALYSDDLAADLRGDFRDLIGEGLSADETLERLSSEYSSSLADPDEAPVFWLAIADTAWRLGRPQERATKEALRVIETGADLRRWEDAEDRRKREAVLQELAAKLRSTPPPAKRIAKPFIANNAWEVGEVIAYRLASGAWTLFRVIGHHLDKGGRYAICEPLDWTGPAPPDPRQLPRLKLRPSVPPWKVSQFFLGEPRRKQDVVRFVRTGARSAPTQEPGGYFIFILPRLDLRLREIFGLE